MAAHSNQLMHGKGRGIKASDQFVAALCYQCHHEVDQGMSCRQTKLMIWNEAHERTKFYLEQAGLWPAN